MEGRRFKVLTKCGVQGDHPPAGVWGIAPKPYAAAFFMSVASVQRREGKRVPCGHLPPEVAKRPGAHRREASALWAVAAKGGKATRRREQIQGLRAVSAQNADICERANTRTARGQRAERRYLRGQRNHERAGGNRQPCGLLGRRPKATRRREQIQGLCAAAHRTPIFAKGREARMIEQPGRKKRGSSQNQGFFNDLSAALPQWKGGALRQALANLPRTLSICCCWACSLGYQPWAAIFW